MLVLLLTLDSSLANFEKPVLGCIEADFLQVNSTEYSLELGSSLKKEIDKKWTWMKKYDRD